MKPSPVRSLFACDLLLIRILIIAGLGVLPSGSAVAARALQEDSAPQVDSTSQVDPERWDQPPAPLEPQLAAASDAGELAIASFKVPAGWRVELFAAEPMVANGVALHVDFDGTVLVCESYRQEQGIEDNRGHGHWLLDDLAARTIEDRRDYILKHLGADAVKYTQQDDRIRLLRDTDGDGQADVSSVFASGFNTLLSGTGAGVLRYRGQTYYTCIPDLWLLTAGDNPDVAAERKVLHRGYGVRFAFRGHDSHAPVIGPDGRLYFSIGDRGYNITTESGHWVDPASGAVFRCNLDGSDLQVVATGLRNPQGLAFDDQGNLFTGDNNSDSGDQAKWFYIAPGGDYGWRMHYQYLPDRGPYNRERLWNLYDPSTTPAYVIPPIANISDGPSGLVHYPGTGFSDEWLGSFLLCDFRGQSSSSGLRRLRNQPVGAFFQLSEAAEPIWRILATDAKFGPDGALYVLDWVEGWVGEGKGRVYRVFDPAGSSSEAARQTKRLLGGELWQGANADLQGWLAHPDQRVRQEAQFELVRRGQLDLLLSTAGAGATNQSSLAGDQRLSGLSRLHGIWGSFQWYRETPVEQRQEQLETFLAQIPRWLQDEDDEVRAITAQQIMDLQHPIDWQPLVDLVSDRNARVAYSAMLALGRQRVAAAGAAVLERLNANADADPILRHGAIMAIAGINDESLWLAVRRHSSPAVRLAGVVAGRKAQRPGMADWLKDGDLRVVTEAARAIYDTPLLSELPALAAYLPLAGGDDGLARRAIQANDFLAQAENAERLAAFAAATGGSIERRMEALQVLAQWDQPRPLEAVMNDYRPRPVGRAEDAVTAIRQALPTLLTAEAEVANKTSEVAAGLGLAEVAPILQACFEDPQQSGARRAAALRSWVGLQGAEILGVIRAAGLDPAVEVRAAALEAFAEVAPEAAGIAFDVALRGDLREQQAALRSLGRLPNDAQTALLAVAVSQRTAGEFPRGAELEMLEALELPAAAGLRERWQRARAGGAGEAEGEAAGATVGQRYPELLQGGDVARGRRVFFEKTAVSCVRCHAVQGVGGAVGPELSGIGTQKDRAYLLEAILEPNAAIATGFETQLILDLEGVTHLGIVKAETDDYVELMDADGRLVRIPQDDIEERRRGQSSMPDGMDEKLSRYELRDLVEYLASLSAAKTE